MSRYRPPRPRSSPYITRQGYERLQTELAFLWKEKRPEITRRVAAAAALGDRSENADYIYGKRQLREVDARIQYLSKRLDAVEVVERVPPDRTRVFFGAWVTVADVDGVTQRYRIVGADEIGTEPGWISIDAPLARLLIGKTLDDEVVLEPVQAGAPGTTRVFDPGIEAAAQHLVIVAIEYQS